VWPAHVPTGTLTSRTDTRTDEGAVRAGAEWEDIATKPA
jgi:hypothetical protein